MSMTEDQRIKAALAGQPGYCRAKNYESPTEVFMCYLDDGHEGEHLGFELPTIELDEPW